jgi:SAM-dependent methyltransferase
MKKLPEVNASFEDLYGILIAPIRTKLLLTGIELKVFNHLSEPKTADTVAEAIESHPENMRHFLDGLAANDLIRKKNGLYQNTAVTQEFLVEGSPTYLGEFLVSQIEWHKPVLDDLATLVMEGPPQAQEMDTESEGVWGKMAALVANYERSGVAQQIASIVSELPGFPTFTKMLDLGGGPGLLGIAIVAAHPDMRGVIFDRPAVAGVAEGFIEEYDVADRMTVMGGDYVNDPIGEGYDLILASATLNFVKDDLESFFGKVYDALNPGGLFITLSDGLTDERTKPELMVTGWLLMALTGQDKGFDQDVIADSMLSVGFRSVRSRTLAMPMGPMDLDIGRKARSGEKCRMTAPGDANIRGHCRLSQRNHYILKFYRGACRVRERHHKTQLELKRS